MASSRRQRRRSPPAELTQSRGKHAPTPISGHGMGEDLPRDEIETGKYPTCHTDPITFPLKVWAGNLPLLCAALHPE